MDLKAIAYKNRQTVKFQFLIPSFGPSEHCHGYKEIGRVPLADKYKWCPLNGFLLQSWFVCMTGQGLLSIRNTGT